MGQLEEMQNFVRVIEAGSISKAAEQLNIAKSGVSRRLAELENRLGVRLLNRTTRRSSLTEAGRLFFERAVKLIGDVAGSQLTHVYLAHMSDECNRLDIAVDAVQKKLFERGFRQVKILPTYRDRPSEVCAIDN